MPRYDASTARVLVFTFKEGLLSRVAHDLKLEVGSFAIEVDEGRVEATFDPTSLRTLCARKKGRDAPDALSEKDKRDIEANIARDVLHPQRFPEIRFVSTAVERRGADLRVAGDLTLHGTTRRVEATAREEGGTRVAELTLHQPDFGIQPYRAALGALKVKPDVRVRVELPA